MPPLPLLPSSPAALASHPPCRTCRRFSPLTPQQMHRSLGDFSFLPDVRAAMASATAMGFCPVQHEMRDAAVGCEHWEGKRWGALRAWWRRRRGVDPDVALTERLAERRKADEHARLLARGAAARSAIPDPRCPVCHREHAVCDVCNHRRPTCGVCDVCGLEGVVVTAGANATTPPSWYCSRAPAHHGVGLPEHPPYPGGVCPGCREVGLQREVLERALAQLKPSTRVTLAAARLIAPALSKEVVIAALDAAVRRGRLLHRLGVVDPTEGMWTFPRQEETRQAIQAGASVEGPGGYPVNASQVVDLWERV